MRACAQVGEGRHSPHIYKDQGPSARVGKSKSIRARALSGLVESSYYPYSCGLEAEDSISDPAPSTDFIEVFPAYKVCHSLLTSSHRNNVVYLVVPRVQTVSQCLVYCSGNLEVLVELLIFYDYLCVGDGYDSV